MWEMYIQLNWSKTLNTVRFSNDVLVITWKWSITPAVNKVLHPESRSVPHGSLEAYLSRRDKLWNSTGNSITRIKPSEKVSFRFLYRERPNLVFYCNARRFYSSTGNPPRSQLDLMGWTNQQDKDKSVDALPQHSHKWDLFSIHFARETKGRQL